jgi:hypothetical protein
MSHTVPISEELYEKIAAYAAERQQQVEALIELWLADAVHRATESPSTGPTSPLNDPLFQVAGILASDDPGWGRRHDELLAEAYGDTHADEC